MPRGRGRVVLRVHPSNFVISGFTESPDPAAVAALAHRHGALVIDDLGSGALLPTERYGLAHEPMPSERLAAGADLVTFSGDKLLGGPQAGLVVGRADLDRPAPTGSTGPRRPARQDDPRGPRRDPRAVPGRSRRGTDSGLADDRRRSRGPPGTGRIDPRRPCPRRSRSGTSVEAMDSTVGGGSLPGETLPSFGLAVRAGSAARMLAELRRGSPCVVARIADDAVLLDLRTVPAADDAALGQAIAHLRAG